MPHLPPSPSSPSTASPSPSLSHLHAAQARHAALEAFEPRAVCPRCTRPSRVCWCAHLPSIVPETRVLLLQHPREEDVAIGTARMASLCLEGAELVVGVDLEDDPRVRAALDDATRTPVLLWPGGEAVDITVDPPRGPTTLVVVDGTWSLARKLVRRNPRIAALPRYALGMGAPSEYRIRREPAEGCVSTIEAIARALGAIERDPERFRPMLAPFRAMVDMQIDHEQRLQGGRVRARAAGPKPKRPRPVPCALAEPSRVVVIGAEGNAWPYDQADRPADAIVHLVAARLDGTGSLDVLVSPGDALSPTTPTHARLDAAAILAAPGPAAMADAWHHFLRDDDVVLAWGPYAFDLVERAGGRLPAERIDLRVATSDFLGKRPGAVDTCCASLGLTAEVLGIGRAGARLGATVAIARHLAAALAARS